VLTERLVAGSPNRETSIKYVFGNGVGKKEEVTVPNFQGCKNPYKSMRATMRNFSQNRASLINNTITNLAGESMKNSRQDLEQK
jgi:hypothetical protein